jgi:hypothetical protein
MICFTNLTMPICPGDGVSCSSEEIAAIDERLDHQQRNRELAILGPYDDPCRDKCVGFPPGYCYMLFCRARKPRRTLRKHKQETLAEVTLSECIGDLEAANDAMNLLFRERNISKGCRKLISGSRHFACFNSV